MLKLILSSLFFIIILSSPAQELNKNNVYFKIHDAALKAKEKKAEGMQTLYNLSLVDHKDPVINKMLIKNTLLAMIGTNSSSLKNYIFAADSKFLTLDTIDFLNNPPYQVKCFKCQGEKILKEKCKLCIKGVCKNCKGKRVIVYQGINKEVRKKCTICKAKGKCVTCDSKGIFKKDCHVCLKKGTIFSRNAVPQEYIKSLDFIISFMPKYAAGKKLLITDEMLEIAKKDELKKELEMAENMQKKEFTGNTKSSSKHQNAPKKLTPQTRKALLKNVVLEFNQFFKSRESISKQKIFDSADAQLIENTPTLIISVNQIVAGAEKELKLQYLEAFYYFFKMRCSRNGLGNNAGFVAKFKDKELATAKDGAVILK